MRNLNFLLFLALTLVLVVALRLRYLDHQEMKVHPMTNELAMEPDQMIKNAKHYLKEHQRRTTIVYIDKAISAMRLIEKDADSLSNQAIESAIEDMEAVARAFRNRQINESQMNDAFSKALTSLAYAQLRISQRYRQSGKPHLSLFALNYASRHLENAVQFSPPKVRGMEISMYNSIDSLIENEHLPEQEIQATLEAMIRELDTLVTH